MAKSPNRFVPSGKLKALELREGSGIGVSNAASGRLRYNEVTNHVEVSENTGAFTSLLGTEHGIITLTPLGGGADDAPQLAAAEATGKIVILAPGTYNFAGTAYVTTRAVLALHAVGTAQTIALKAVNPSAATIGVQQYSPAGAFEGQAWDVTAGASAPVSALIQCRGVQGAAVAQAQFDIYTGKVGAETLELSVGNSVLSLPSLHDARWPVSVGGAYWGIGNSFYDWGANRDESFGIGYNCRGIGQLDSAKIAWFQAFETNYVVGADVFDEWYVQFNSVAGGGAYTRRPLGCAYNRTTDMPYITASGTFAVTTADGLTNRFVVATDTNDIHLSGTVYISPVTSGGLSNFFKANDSATPANRWIATWAPVYIWTKTSPIHFIDTAGTGYVQFQLNASDELCIGTTDVPYGAASVHVPTATKLGAAILWPSYVTTPGITQAAADLGHGTAPSDIHLQAQDNTHADTPLKGNVHALSPVIFPSVTDAEEAALTPVAGMVVYNTTDSKLRVYSGGAWVDLH